MVLKPTNFKNKRAASLKNPAGIKKKGAMIGQNTSKKMKEKLDQIKNKKRIDDEEVQSTDSNGTFDGDENLNSQRQKQIRQNKKHLLLDDPFLLVEDAQKEQIETIEEKKLRMAKEVIAEYASEKKNDFFESLLSKTQADYQIVEEGDDLITRRMKMHLLE